MKRLLISILSLSFVSLFFLNFNQNNSFKDSKLILEKYLEAIYNQNYEEASLYFSNKEFLKDREKIDDNLWYSLMKDSYFKIEQIEIIDKSVIKYSVFEYLPNFDAFIKNKNNTKIDMRPQYNVYYLTKKDNDQWFVLML